MMKSRDRQNATFVKLNENRERPRQMLRGVLLYFCSASIVLAGLSVLHSSAQAFCGMVSPIQRYEPGESDYQLASAPSRLSQPRQQAFIKWDPEEKIEAVTVQPQFEGNVSNFGMIIPTPSRPKIDEMPRDLFKNLANYTTLLPAPVPIHLRHSGTMLAAGSGYMSAPSARSVHMPSASYEPVIPTVRVLEAGVVGSLDYKIIAASNSKDFFDWLAANHYSIGKDEDAFQYYIRKNWFFTVMKIDPKQMKKSADGNYLGAILPTRFTFSSEQCVYPLRITQNSITDKTEALFYLEAPAEMDLPDRWSWRHKYSQEFSRLLNGRDSFYDGYASSGELLWSKQLLDSDLKILEDPQDNFSKMVSCVLPGGASVIPYDEFISSPDAGTLEFDRFKWTAKTGMVVKYAPDMVAKSAFDSPYVWFANRTLPEDQGAGLTLLKGHLEKNRWLTKFSKTFEKNEMADDMVLRPVSRSKEIVYTRPLLPRSWTMKALWGGMPAPYHQPVVIHQPPAQEGVLLPTLPGTWHVTGVRTGVEVKAEYQKNLEDMFSLNTSQTWSISGDSKRGYKLSILGSEASSDLKVTTQQSQSILRYDTPIRNVTAQKAVVLQVGPGGDTFDGLLRITIVKPGEGPRAKITYKLTGHRESSKN